MATIFRHIGNVDSNVSRKDYDSIASRKNLKELKDAELERGRLSAQAELRGILISSYTVC